MIKRAISFIIIILYFILFVSFLPFGQCEDTIGDDVKTDFSSIQEAIDTTFEGDTIYIYAGEYYEDILINKSVTLEGKSLNGYVPVIIGNVTIAANNVTVSNLRIQNGSGIRIVGFVGTGYSDTIYYNNTIKNNVIVNSSHSGIYLRWAYYTNISGNTIKNNEAGINLQYAGYNNIKENTIENNEAEGIWLSHSWENTFYKNTIQNNNYGFNFFFYADENIIHENTIQNNNAYGMYHLVDKNIPNIFFNNNFINNTIHASDGGINYWNDSAKKQGNYWDDYNGSDNNNDGIGDKPYNIRGGDNQDKYPLMKPYGTELPKKPEGIDTSFIYPMLIIAMIVAIIFCLPIAYYWRKKWFT